MQVTEIIKSKKISLNQVISLSILIIASIIALKIYQGQNIKIVQIRFSQEEQKKKNDILLRIGDVKTKFQEYKNLFKQKDSREVINEITNIARASGVKIVSLRPKETQKTTKPQWQIKEEIFDKDLFELRIDAEGYHKIGDLVNNLEISPMAFFIESLSIRSTVVDRYRRFQVSGEVEKLTVRVNLIVSKLYIPDITY